MNPRAVYRDCVEAIGPLLRNPAVAAKWDGPSALAEMTVSALAGHLIRVLSTVERYLSEPEPLEEGRLSPVRYFANLPTSVDDPQNVAIRQRGAEEAAAGYDALIAEYDRLRTSVLEAM
ncbi:MAG: maleylpyruvate isomerase N-terminal domain-containing protein, partial [Acidimicrobiia bacterium]